MMAMVAPLIYLQIRRMPLDEVCFPDDINAFVTAVVSTTQRLWQVP